MLRLLRPLWLTACAVAIAAATAAPAAAQKKSANGAGQGEFVKVDFTEPEWQGAYYTVFVPKGVAPGRAYPLVVALHGNGAKSDGHCRNLAKVSTADAPAFVVAPQYQQGNQFNNPLYTPTGKLLKTMLDAVVAKYPIDESRLVLQGFSMGGNTLASWTYAWMAQDPDSYPFDMIWFSSTAIPPHDGRNGTGGQVAPKIPMLLMTGSKETNVLGLVNVVKQTREAYRVFHQRGHDARYIQIPEMGHAVNGTCIEIMRDALTELPSVGGAVKAAKSLPEAAKAAVALANQGKFAGALAELEQLRAAESALTATEKGKVATQVKSIEKFLKSHAASESKRLTTTFTPSGYDNLLALSASLAAHDTLGQVYAKAVDKLQKHKVVQAQLAAREAFVAAAGIEDSAASLAAMGELAGGKFKMTLFGLRAAAHLQAMSDDWGDGAK